VHRSEKALLRSLGATEHSAEQRNVLSGAECCVCAKAVLMTNLTATVVVKLLFFGKGLQILPWNGWMKPPTRPSHPGMFWQLLLEYFKLAICSVFCVTFFLFTEKKMTILLLLNFHPKTTGWPRMVDFAL
jgi:hypothetical protein